MIKLEKLCKTFKNINEKKQVLDKVSFSIQEGKITGFLGVNGSGKTTLIKMILQFISSDSGNIIYNKSISNSRGGYHSIGYLPERPYYYTNLTGLEFLNFSVSLSKKVLQGTKDEWLNYARRLSLDDALDRKLEQYSKGMLQKIGFIANLVSGCKLLILDEPLSGLDLISREEYKKILTEYSKNGGSVFISSHILSDLEEVTDNIVFLDSKKIRFEGKASDFFGDLESGEFIVKYLSEDQVMSVKSPEDKLQDCLQKLNKENSEIISVKRERKSFQDYVREVRGEC